MLPSVKYSTEKYRGRAIANELAAILPASVRIGGNPIYAHTSTFVYVFSFPACEAGD